MPDLMPGKCLIDGAWVAGIRTAEVRNPATGACVGTVPSLGAAETRAAITAAAAALADWSAVGAEARAAVLRRLHDLLIARADALARILTAEQGKPLAEARAEIAYAASFVQWFAEEGPRAYGDVIPSPDPTKRILVLKQPVGVCAAITPWNFPAAMVTRKLAPALAAGCTIVLKPAEQTPMTALAIGVLAQEAGVPAGVLNIVTGPAREIGAELTGSPEVRKLTFTGSTEVGAALFAQCAPTIKKLSLELGGNAPFVVFDDADLDAAVVGAMAAKFRNAGQTCVCPNRFYVQAGIHDAFVTRFAEAAARLRIGPGDAPDSEIGPLIDDAAVAKVAAHVADATDKGARVVTGGAIAALGGRYFSPTVIADVDPTMAVAREETFGPLVAISRFDDEAEAVTLANATPFGLAAYVYTRDLGRSWRMAEALEAGMVGINTGMISTAVAPFGGIRASGLGREGSKYGLDDYLELKTVCVSL